MINLTRKQLEIARQALVEKFERTKDHDLKLEIVEITSLINDDLELNLDSKIEELKKVKDLMLDTIKNDLL